MKLSLELSEIQKIEKQKLEDEAKPIIKPSVKQDKEALDDLLGFLDEWERGDEEFEELEPTTESGIVSIPKSVGLGLSKEVKAVTGTQSHVMESVSAESKFKVYEDEVPPIPLEDYTPMAIEGEPVSEERAPVIEKPVLTEQPPPFDELPSFEELGPPDFESEVSASEYDTEFVLEEESEALGSVLRDLGWEEED
jgi:hypothetical protein